MRHGIRPTALMLSLFLAACGGGGGGGGDAPTTPPPSSTTPPPATPPVDGNLAYHQPTIGSTEQRPSLNAVDGDLNTSWACAPNTLPSWLTVDLGSQKHLTKTEVAWGDASATAYTVLGSNDLTTWTTLAELGAGAPGSRVDSFAVSGDFRYLRVYVTASSQPDACVAVAELRAFGGEPTPLAEAPVTDPKSSLTYVPLYASGTLVDEVIQYREPDGTLVTLTGWRPTERHARERGEDWNAPDQGPGRYLTFPSFYFQNRTFGLEIRDSVGAGGAKIQFFLHVNQGDFRGTTFSLFRNVLDPNVRDYGWALNYGFNNPYENNEPLCHARTRECMMEVDSNWRTDPHSPLKVGDKVELAPAPRLTTPVVDGGGERYYSFEQLYLVGQGMRPWYGIAPNLDSEPLPDSSLLGGDASFSYNYSEEPMRLFQQMANNIGISNTQHFVEGRRLFHTSFVSGLHSEDTNRNPAFEAHAHQAGPGFNEERCISCHTLNGRSQPLTPGAALAQYSVLTGAGNGKPDPVYGFNIQVQGAGSDRHVTLSSLAERTETLADGSQVIMHTPHYSFAGPTPVQFSVRQAPQIIGLGLLEAIDEDAILARADDNDGNGDGISGRAQFVTEPDTGLTRLGRFGWKAGKASLRHQAAEALLLDLGVTSPVYPRESCQHDDTGCHAAGATTEVSTLELTRLRQYLSLLAVPAQRNLRSGFPDGVRVPKDLDVDPALIARGQTVFQNTGCESCHRASFTTGTRHPLAEMRGQVIHPYTDLLLHDLGPELADGLSEGRASGSEWRTPPLWGIGNLPYVQGEGRARYLHDGRAQSLEEAILWHGGEADGVKAGFKAMSTSDRQALLAFLNSL